MEAPPAVADLTSQRTGPLPFGILDQQWSERSLSDREQLVRTLGDIELAEALGFDSYMLGEHHFRKPDAPFPARIPWPELVVSHAAALTDRIRLGTGVKVLALDPPWRTAEAMLTLDLVTGGRSFYGLGAGGDEPEVFHPRELDAHGRRALFRETLGDLLALLRSDGTSRFANRLTPVVDGGTVADRIWVAARDEPTITYAASEDLNYVVGQAEIAEVTAPYVSTYRAAGGRREVRAVRIVIVGPDDETALELARPAYEIYSSLFLRIRYYLEHAARLYDTPEPVDYADGLARMCFVVGGPERVTQRLATEVGVMGADRLDVMFQVPGLPDRARRDSMRSFATEVAPTLATRLAAERVRQEAV